MMVCRYCHEEIVIMLDGTYYVRRDPYPWCLINPQGVHLPSTSHVPSEITAAKEQLRRIIKELAS